MTDINFGSDWFLGLTILNDIGISKQKHYKCYKYYYAGATAILSVHMIL